MAPAVVGAVGAVAAGARQTVLGVDIGIRNMAYCLVRTGRGDAGRTVERADGVCVEVLQMECFSVGVFGSPQQRLVLGMCERLNATTFVCAPDAIVIENQLASSTTLRTLQFAMQGYFHSRYRGVPVRFQGGECKMQMCDTAAVAAAKLSGRSKYRTNKKFALEQARRDFEGTVWQTGMDSVRKNDDLADAYLHALFYTEHRL